MAVPTDVPVEVSCAGVGPTPEGATPVAVSADDSAAERLNQLWELLRACLNHELHGPLTVIHGHAQLLEASVTDPAATESLEAIREAVQTMRHITKDLALITGDGPPPDTAEIDARSLLREVIRDLPSLKARTVVEESSRAVLRGDRRRLRQCLLIVLSNADKYAPDGTITVTLDGEGDWGVIAVSDEGPGIPENERASVLRPYGRSAATRDRPGKGLGLYIANVLMASMSGRIDLASAPAGGLRAELRLPLAAARHAARHGEKSGPVPPPTVRASPAI
jgi:signal transduction histidine kinase